MLSHAIYDRETSRVVALVKTSFSAANRYRRTVASFCDRPEADYAIRQFDAPADIVNARDLDWSDYETVTSVP